MPDLSDLPPIEDLLVNNEFSEVSRDFASPSPARAVPHDETAWLPIPDDEDLPTIEELREESIEKANPPLEPVTISRKHLFKRSGIILLVAASAFGLYFLVSGFLDAGDDVTIQVDGRNIFTETGAQSVGGVLREKNIKVGKYDSVSPKVSTSIENEMSVKVVRSFPVAVDVDGQPATVFTTHSKPESFLADARKQLKLDSKVIFRSPPTQVGRNSEIKLRSEKIGTLLVDGSAVNYKLPAMTVAELLDSSGVKLGPEDYTQPVTVSGLLPNNEVITVVRVATNSVSALETYLVDSVILPDPNLPVGETRETPAVAGVQRVTYSVRNLDGKESSRTVISMVPVQEAVPAITYFGTLADPRWDKIAECETGGNWRAYGPTYQGGLGIFYQTWTNFGGRDFAGNAGSATREEQIIVAERIRKRYGFSAWGCGRQLGYR